MALTFAAAVGGGDGPRAGTAHELETIMQDDALLLHRHPDAVRATAQRMKVLGVNRVRITAGWSELAPQAKSRTQPDFDAGDSSDYPQPSWQKLDTAVKEVRRAGMDVMLDVAFFAPRWAVRRGSRDGRHRYRPKWQEFGKFAHAVADRYDGDFRDPASDDDDDKLPAIRLWTTWNEPNHPVFLLPQWKRGPKGTRLAASPHIYRNLHNAGYQAIKGVNPENQVLMGGLAADAGRSGKGMAPLRFLRELACVDGSLKPLRRRACRDFEPLHADGFAHHPYTLETSPAASSPNPDDVWLSDMGRLTRTLRALRDRGRIAGSQPVYITEYGYETNPPDPVRGVSPATQARYLGLASYIAWRNPELRSFAQFLLRDIEPPPGKPGGDYQTGLLYPDGSDKPALQAFRLPIWAEVRRVRTLMGPRRRVVIFGQVRPGRGKRRRVEIELRGRDRVWRDVHTLPSASTLGARCVRAAGSFFVENQGHFLRNAPYVAPGGLYRYRWILNGKRSETSPPFRLP